MSSDGCRLVREQRLGNRLVNSAKGIRGGVFNAHESSSLPLPSNMAASGGY
jgi:hypothetical protein